MHVINRLIPVGSELSKKIEWIEGDVIDFFSIDDAMEGVETIFHAAALISFYQSDRKKMQKVNVEGTANMVNIALKKNVKRFCFISSVASLGRIAGEEFVNENSWWKTSKKNSNYAISKYGAEREVWRAIEEGLSAFIVNPAIIIGAGDWKIGSAQLFSQVWKGLAFYTDGITGFVDVRDVSKSAILLMEKGVSNSRYIVNSENVSYRYVINHIAENFKLKKPHFRIRLWMAEIGWRFEILKSRLLGVKPLLTKETARNGLMKWYYSNEKIKKEIGIDFIPVNKSIEHTCRVFLTEHRIKDPR